MRPDKRLLRTWGAHESFCLHKAATTFWGFPKLGVRFFGVPIPGIIVYWVWEPTILGASSELRAAGLRRPCQTRPGITKTRSRSTTAEMRNCMTRAFARFLRQEYVFAQNPQRWQSPNWWCRTKYFDLKIKVLE